MGFAHWMVMVGNKLAICTHVAERCGQGITMSKLTGGITVLVYI